MVSQPTGTIYIYIMFQSKKPAKMRYSIFLIGPCPFCQASLGVPGTEDMAIGKATPEVRIETVCVQKRHMTCCLMAWILHMCCKSCVCTVEYVNVCDTYMFINLVGIYIYYVYL